MPARKDIRTVLIIGSGPIVIGQACEFDYSGTQACKALRAAGYRVVLVNSNPATIMTDPVMADATYIEPLALETIEKIIAREKPEAILPNLGGQTALNLVAQLHRHRVLEKHRVRIIGVQAEAIERGEDRIAFKAAMNRLGIDLPRSEPAYSVPEAEAIARRLGYPVVVRPAYTLGGTGGGLAWNVEELQAVSARGIDASLVGQVLIEESVLGWEELELEVVRDESGAMITVCFIENVDPMGVHTGDSFCVAPFLTVEPEVRARLETIAHRIVAEVGVIGGTNVQLAHDPASGRIVVIEINPRTSRSSALASKATGFPIALVSAQLAAGLRLAELPGRDGVPLARYRPADDYVVAKFARWAFEKFPGARDRLGTQMRAVGEAMSIGRNYLEAFQKVICSLETGHSGPGGVPALEALAPEALCRRLAEPSSERHFLIYAALRRGVPAAEICRLTGVKRWFVDQLDTLLALEKEVVAHRGGDLPAPLLRRAKEHGFSDAALARLLACPEARLRGHRQGLGLRPAYRPVNVAGPAGAYYYSTYNGADDMPVSPGRKIMILGGGPNRIGQGIEFDYTCVHAALALRELGIGSIMVNCNPETVSTDYDTADKLYFEPLSVESVCEIYEREKPEGVIVQFGGQTPLNIAADLAAAGVRILGTHPENINRAEDRQCFARLAAEMGIPQPESGVASSAGEALAVAEKIGYPLIVRPSYVLGGRGMEVVYDRAMLTRFIEAAVDVSPARPVFIDKFLENAVEAEADAIADGHDAFVPAVMEHIELAGIHSGDSACVLPPRTIPARHLATIEEYTRRVARALDVVGLLNIQYAVFEDTVYILEANPRASRTVPLVSKVTGLPMASLALRVMTGQRLATLGLKPARYPYFGVKEAVFPFNMFPEVDPQLGPEMRSTGEVLGLAESFGLAFYKAQAAAGVRLPTSGTVLITVARRDRTAILPAARRLVAEGLELVATAGTAGFLAEHGISARVIKKLHEGRPHILDAVHNGEIDLIINTASGKESAFDDSYIRKSAIRCRLPYVTTPAAALAAAEGIAAERRGAGPVKSLQEYHRLVT